MEFEEIQGNEKLVRMVLGNGKTITIPKKLEHSAPKFALGERENHGFGYHVHLEELSNGIYKRTGHILILKDGVVYAVNHGNKGRTSFNIEEKRSAILREVEGGLEEMFKGISEEEILNPSRGAAEFYRFQENSKPFY